MIILYVIFAIAYIFVSFVWLGMSYKNDGLKWKDLIIIPVIVLFWPFLAAISIGMAIRKASENNKETES